MEGSTSLKLRLTRQLNHTRACSQLAVDRLTRVDNATRNIEASFRALLRQLKDLDLQELACVTSNVADFSDAILDKLCHVMRNCVERMVNDAVILQKSSCERSVENTIVLLCELQTKRIALERKHSEVYQKGIETKGTKRVADQKRDSWNSTFSIGKSQNLSEISFDALESTKLGNLDVKLCAAGHKLLDNDFDDAPANNWSATQWPPDKMSDLLCDKGQPEKELDMRGPEWTISQKEELSLPSLLVNHTNDSEERNENILILLQAFGSANAHKVHFLALEAGNDIDDLRDRKSRDRHNEIPDKAIRPTSTTNKTVRIEEKPLEPRQKDVKENIGSLNWTSPASVDPNKLEGSKGLQQTFPDTFSADFGAFEMPVTASSIVSDPSIPTFGEFMNDDSSITDPSPVPKALIREATTENVEIQSDTNNWCDFPAFDTPNFTNEIAFPASDAHIVSQVVDTGNNSPESGAPDASHTHSPFVIASDFAFDDSAETAHSFGNWDAEISLPSEAAFGDFGPSIAFDAFEPQEQPFLELLPSLQSLHLFPSTPMESNSSRLDTDSFVEIASDSLQRIVERVAIESANAFCANVTDAIDQVPDMEIRVPFTEQSQIRSKDTNELSVPTISECNTAEPSSSYLPNDEEYDRMLQQIPSAVCESDHDTFTFEREDCEPMARNERGFSSFLSSSAEDVARVIDELLSDGEECLHDSTIQISEQLTLEGFDLDLF